MNIKKILSVSISLILCASCTAPLSEEYEIKEGYVGNVLNSDGQSIQPFNTMVTFRAFNEKNYEELFPIFQNKMQQLHKEFDRYNYYLNDNNEIINNLRVINESYGNETPINISDDLYDLLEQSINLSVLTEGYFNPTLGNLSDTWMYKVDDSGVKSQRFTPYCFEDVDPTSEEISKAMESIVPYDKLEEVIVLDEENKTVTFNKYNDVDNVTLSLGAIAKGFAVEEAKKELEVYNVPLMISGGTSSSYSLYKNPNPDRDYWLIGIASPYKVFYEPTSMFTMKIDNTYTLSVSGDYESSYYKIENDKKIIRHHILNPYTGYPMNYSRVLSLYSNQESGILDALSTALFNIEDDTKKLEIIENVESSYNINIELLYEKEVGEKKIDLYMTKGYKSMIHQYNANYINKEYIIDSNEGE